MIDAKYIKEVLDKATLMISPAELKQALDNMAAKMQKVLVDKDPIFIVVMNGGMVVASELAMRLNFPLQMDYIHVTRYCGETTGGDVTHWRKEPELDLTNRTVVIIDDILDKGVTLATIYDYCKKAGASELFSAVLLDKKVTRDPGGEQRADFVGVEIEDKYVFGFGLDYHDYLRNVPAIYHVAKEHMH